jgi:tetratricopeptide (TPR) repeat protein
VARTRLDSWKAIAEYLKRSSRTVQRWHADFSLPVYHFGGGKGPVFSYSDELDVWLSGFSEDAAQVDPTSPSPMADRRKSSEELTAAANALWDARSETNVSAAVALYRAAVDLDPANADALIGAANALILSVLVGTVRGSAAYPRAREALLRARRIGHDRGQMLCATAWLNMTCERNWKFAHEGFDQALQHDPQSAHALAGRALLQIAEGNPGFASQCLHDAWSQNTFASVVTAFRSWSQYLAGENKHALEIVSDARSSGEAGPLIAAVEALAILQAGPQGPWLARIEELAVEHPSNLLLRGALGYAYGVSDQPGRALGVLNSLDRLQGDSLYPHALVYFGLHEWQQTLSCLEASYAEGSLWSLGFRCDPLLQPLREDPRLAARMYRLGPTA